MRLNFADFYTREGLARLRAFIKPGGVFALWSNEVPDKTFLALLGEVFGQAEGHTVTFDNPAQGRAATNGVYVLSCQRTTSLDRLTVVGHSAKLRHITKREGML
jgi:hypothetical protein